jgi:predicted AAA+ superfamily ATPase
MDKQLIKENRKFQYNLIRKGATQTMYAEALEYIRDTFYGIYCCKLEEEYFKQTPEQLKSLFQTPEVNSNFKLYLPDTGILNSILYTQYSDLTDQMKKGRLENYVVQSLKANGYTFSFWESSSQAKIEIILLQEDYVLPVEIRINDMTRSKNISVFRNQYNRVKDSIKISTRNFDYSNNVKYVPLYAVFCI